MHIGAKDHPSAIRSKAYVGLEAIFVFREIDELFNNKRTSLRCEQKYPLPTNYTIRNDQSTRFLRQGSGLEFRVQGSGFRVQRSGFSVQSSRSAFTLRIE